LARSRHGCKAWVALSQKKRSSPRRVQQEATSVANRVVKVEAKVEAKVVKASETGMQREVSHAAPNAEKVVAGKSRAHPLSRRQRKKRKLSPLRLPPRQQPKKQEKQKLRSPGADVVGAVAGVSVGTALSVQKRHAIFLKAPKFPERKRLKLLLQRSFARELNQQKSQLRKQPKLFCPSPFRSLHRFQ
jgi:hypothetical protein